MAELWVITDHVCAVCLGRVLKRKADDGQVIVRCSNCGATGERKVEAICVCGIDARKGARIKLHCVRQERPTPEFPSEIVAAEER